jgi:hypothetical protein
MSKQGKYPGIEAAYARYRGEETTNTVTCPGCGLAFTPEEKSEEAAPEAAPETAPAQQAARRLPALDALRAVASPDSDSLNEYQRTKREAADKAHEGRLRTVADLARRTRSNSRRAALDPSEVYARRRRGPTGGN